MANRIKSAFQAIHLEESIKKATLEQLAEKMEAGTKPRRAFLPKRMAMAGALLVMLFGVFFYNSYFTKAAYIDIDINPSFAVTVNKFNRVIAVDAYNADAEELLSSLNLQHKKVDVAMDEILAATASTGALQQSGLVTVTIQSVSANEEELLFALQTEIPILVAHHGGASVNVFAVDGSTRNIALTHHISPAKYLAILELQAIDPTITIDGCSNHSISEIQQIIEAHHAEEGEEEAAPTATNNDCDNTSSSGGTHHGKKHH